LIIKIREENQQRMLNLLEKKLAIRTNELMIQKQLVEEQNKDIVDSINYALRIQTALLPEIKLLKQHLPESFVMYKPRDIVSGDFYWFSRSGDRLLLACADCTGHGVPGAFMSMIGNTLFNEIVPLCDETDPAQMLYLLDEKMCQLLQHETAESLNDGMDVVLLSLDMQTGELIFSGAVRPVLHFSDGKPEQYRTSRHSIGGKDESKAFTNQRIWLKKGDTVYVFSDGFVDQFGGPEKRKLRSKGLTELLNDLQNLSMEEQRFMVEDFFYKWSDREHQIDDVLLIGFRFLPETESKESSVYRLSGGIKEEHIVKSVPADN
jgi:serine phosphatase RsbU (regulator of sigma subunit)